eukprot:2726762-Heterocapsa_arctica.AAC.1
MRANLTASRHGHTRLSSPARAQPQRTGTTQRRSAQAPSRQPLAAPPSGCPRSSRSRALQNGMRTISR